MLVQLKLPLIITPRLLPGVKIGDSFLSIKFHHQLKKYNSRYYYNYYIDTPSFEHSAHDISTHNYDIQEALLTLLSFLSAAAESYYSTLVGRFSDNRDLFPENVMEWAYLNSDEISIIAFKLGNTDAVNW